MKQPFWILNSILLIILFVVLWFIFFTPVKIPPRKNIEPEIHTPLEKKEIHKLDISAIYKNDLFETYKPEFVPEKPEIISEIPKAPEPVIPFVPEQAEPQFLDPLPLTLTGIIAQTDETKNRAIILDNRTNKQKNYKVGDEIEDAQLIRIFRNKIILIRSNGQQEILYVRQEDAKLDNQKLLLKDVIKKIDENNYLIDADNFIEYVKNLGEFIEMLDLIAAYKQGQGIIGSRIGKLEQGTIGLELGLLPGDIIQKVNGMSSDSTANNFQIYKKIISLKENDMINVEILRDNQMVTLSYKLKKLKSKKLPLKAEFEKKDNQLDIMQEKEIEDEKEKILKEKYKFAPTMHEIKLREKQNILKHFNKENN